MGIVLVRHPKPDCQPGLCYGRLDLACQTGALEKAAARFAKIASTHTVVSSPALRARALAEKLTPSFRVEPRLQELNFGAWEGQLWSALGRKAIDDWRLALPDGAPPDGESLTNLALRCGSWLAEIAPDDPPIFAITHAGPIRVLRALTEGRPLLDFFAAPVPYATPIPLWPSARKP